MTNLRGEARPEEKEEEEGKCVTSNEDETISAPAAQRTARVVNTDPSNNNNNNNSNDDMPLGWTQLGTTDGNDAPLIRYPSDVADLDPSETEVCVVGTAGQKITHLGKDLSRRVLNPQLKSLIFRSHLIRTMEGLDHFECLELLELYDNQVTALEGLDSGKDGLPGKTLRVLDMSYNVIRDMDPVALCPNLQELYIANNKLKSMAGLKSLSQLKKIDLGANRIRVMDPDELSGLVQLEELWLGKNKIEKIQGLEHLTKLRRLDIQSNRLTMIENLQTQNDTLEELYLAHNGITVEGAMSAPGSLSQAFPNLSVLDLSRNRLTKTTPFAHLTSLDELWISGNNIATFDDIQPLAALGQSLETVYLEYNPVQEHDPLYRKKLKDLIPSLTQIDANLITTANLLPPTMPPPSSRPPHVKSAMAQNPVAAVPGETEEERLRRLQEAVVQRARKETAAQRPTRTAITTTTTTTPPSTLTGDDDDDSDASSPRHGDGQPGEPPSST